MAEISLSNTVKKTESQVSTEVEGETVILQLESGHYFSLNEVGAVVWAELEQPCVILDLCQRVMEEYDVPAADCERDVLALVQQLLDEQMIVLL